VAQREPHEGGLEVAGDPVLVEDPERPLGDAVEMRAPNSVAGGDDGARQREDDVGRQLSRRPFGATTRRRL